MGPSAGEVLFARYAYPPNQLGYCGPAGAEELLDVASGGDIGGERLADRAAAFDGAWAYLEIIGAAAGLAPLDARVVEAYWVGNELLDHVDAANFTATIRRRFASEAGADWAALKPADDRAPSPSDAVTPTTPVAPVAHHSFHVFTVYPWVRLLGRGDTPRRVLDRCRIRVGEVVGVDGDEALVRFRPLDFDGRILSIGRPVEERARWAQDGKSLLDQVVRGELVALHWDWVCDRLTPERAEELTRRTDAQLALTNRAHTRTQSRS